MWDASQKFREKDFKKMEREGQKEFHKTLPEGHLSQTELIAFPVQLPERSPLVPSPLSLSLPSRQHLVPSLRP